MKLFLVPMIMIRIVAALPTFWHIFEINCLHKAGRGLAKLFAVWPLLQNRGFIPQLLSSPDSTRQVFIASITAGIKPNDTFTVTLPAIMLRLFFLLPICLIMNVSYLQGGLIKL